MKYSHKPLQYSYQNHVKQKVLYRLGFSLIIAFIYFLPKAGIGQFSSDSAGFYFKKASLLAFRGVYDSSIICFEKSNTLYTEAGEKKESFNARIRIAEVLIQKGAFQESYQKIKNLKMEIADVSPYDKQIKSELLRVIGYYYLLTGQLDSAETYLQEALVTKMKPHNAMDTTYTKILNNLGYLQYMLGNYDSAYAFYDKAVKFSLLKKDPANYDISSYYQGKGIALTMKGFYNEAEMNFKKSHE